MSREKKPETTEPDKLESCVSCRCFWPTQTDTFCRLAPPTALVVVQQVKGSLLQGGAPQMVQTIGGFFGPTTPDNWCAQWKMKNFTGDRPAIPVQIKTYRT